MSLYFCETYSTLPIAGRDACRPRVGSCPSGTLHKNQPGGRESPGWFIIDFQPIWLQKRYRITANWARVAVPVGFSVPSLVPPTMLLATDHCRGSTA